jgi:hypothetical protein
MKISIPSETIAYLWQALQVPPRSSRFHQATRRFKIAVKNDWIFSTDIEDILMLMDSRLDGYQFHILKFCRSLEIPVEEIYYRPRAIATGAPAFDGIRTEYFVFLLIQLERLGFEIDVNPYVQQFLPELKKKTKTVLSLPELEMLWYNKSRLKQEDMVLCISGAKSNDKPAELLRLPNGFKLSLWTDSEGNPTLLKIRAPKYRERPRPTTVICENCGLEWTKGDPESSMVHRKEHKKIMSYLDPVPRTEMLAELDQNGLAAELVATTSPKWKHSEIYVRARAFKREMGYDFIQWQSETGDDDPDVQGFLFTDSKGAIVGACAFRHRNIAGQPKWGLQWIWICPRERRNGHLTRSWKQLRQRFGDFVVESPVSPAMRTFLEKQGDTVLMQYDR